MLVITRDVCDVCGVCGVCGVCLLSVCGVCGLSVGLCYAYVVCRWRLTVNGQYRIVLSSVHCPIAGMLSWMTPPYLVLWYCILHGWMDGWMDGWMHG
jgi:hypothetical protein